MHFIDSLGYLVLGTSDLARWEAFAVDILGMQLGWLNASKSVGLRMDERKHRLILEYSQNDEVLAYGWELRSEDELNRLVEQVRMHGVQVERGDPDLAQQRGVAHIYHCQDPVLHYRHEFVCGPQVLDASKSFHSNILKGRFRTGDLGVGHAAFTTPDYARSIDFYRNALGLRVSGYGKGEMAPGVKLEASFLYANSGRHHSLAVLAGNFPKPTRHLMFEFTEMDDVGLALERCQSRAIAIDRTLGVHEGDRMFSFYAVSPAGMPIEIGWGGLVDKEWQAVTFSALSEWGHKKLPR